MPPQTPQPVILKAKNVQQLIKFLPLSLGAQKYSTFESKFCFCVCVVFAFSAWPELTGLSERVLRGKKGYPRPLHGIP